MKLVCGIILGFIIPLIGFTGKVIDSEGRGIPSVELFFTNTVNQKQVYTTHTDVNGNYQLDLQIVGVLRTPLSRLAAPLWSGILFSDEHGKIRMNVPQRGEKKLTLILSDLKGRTISHFPVDNFASESQSVILDLKAGSSQPIPQGVYHYTIHSEENLQVHPIEGHPLSKPAASAAILFNVYIAGRGILPYSQQSLSIEPDDIKNFTLKTTDLWDTRRVVLRSDYNNSRAQFAKGTGRVAFLGGSITHMSGWRNSVQNYLTKNFPDTEFDFIEAGIGGLGSKFHAFRYQRDVAFKGKVDLLFLESAVNDATGYNSTNNVTRVRAHEGIIRQARQDNPDIDVVQLHFLYPEYYANYKNHELIPSIQAYEKVGSYYNSSMQNLARYVAERHTWEEFGANVHPKTFGSSLYSNNVIAMFDEAWKESLPHGYQNRSYPLPADPIDRFSYYKGHFESIDDVVESNWFKSNSWTPPEGKVHVESKNRPALVGTTGNTLKFNFNGTLIGIEANTYLSAGKVSYSIDGDLRTGLANTGTDQNLNIIRAFIFEEKLPDGDHVIELEVENGMVGIFNFLVN